MSQRMALSPYGIPMERPVDGENGWHVEWCESENQGLPSMLIGISAESARRLKRYLKKSGFYRIKAYEIK